MRKRPYTEEEIAARKAYMRAYYKTDAYKASQAKYFASEKGKALLEKRKQTDIKRLQEYNSSEAGKAARKKYYASERYKEKRAKFLASEKGQALTKKYSSNSAERARAYRQTPAGKAAMKKYNESEKGRIAREKYLGSPKASEAVEKYRGSPKGQQMISKRATERYNQFPGGKITCVKCKQHFCKLEATLQNWPMVGKYSCVCEFCQ